MSEVRVTDAGLDRWATQCETTAAGLIGGLTAAPATGPSQQATSAVVLAAHTSAVGATNTASTRLQTTGMKSHLAATAYANNDSSSAQRVVSYGQA